MVLPNINIWRICCLQGRGTLRKLSVISHHVTTMPILYQLYTKRPLWICNFLTRFDPPSFEHYSKKLHNWYRAASLIIIIIAIFIIMAYRNIIVTNSHYHQWQLLSHCCFGCLWNFEDLFQQKLFSSGFLQGTSKNKNCFLKDLHLTTCGLR